LATSAIGAVTFVVSIVETLIQDDLLVGRSARNALLLAITLLIVGLPVWQLLWRRIYRHIEQDREREISAISRKVYLFTVIGISAIAAVVSTLTFTVQIFQGLFGGDIGGSTWRETSYAISILVVGILVGLFHLRVFRHERAEAGPKSKTHKFLLMIGPADKSLARELERSTGARVEIVESLDGLATRWDREKVQQLLMENQEAEIALIADAGQIKAIPIKR
jgi:MFS family permease